MLVAGLTVTPWAVRNYRVFGRVIPTKSNVVYELYQSQCLQPDGLIQAPTFSRHPYGSATLERREYNRLGEIAFLERKRAQFRQAVQDDPVDFLDRVADRFLGATLWYVPFNRVEEAKRPWVLWLSRVTHPLPFLALLVLLFTALCAAAAPGTMGRDRRLLLLSAAVCRDELLRRYAVPLLGAKVLLVIWAADRLLSFLHRKRAVRSEKGVSPPAPPAGKRRLAVRSSS